MNYDSNFYYITVFIQVVSTYNLLNLLLKWNGHVFFYFVSWTVHSLMMRKITNKMHYY
jgi:hypothetical protein